MNEAQWLTWMRQPGSCGPGSIHLLAHDPFFDEADLPFRFLGGGTACHIVPRRGFGPMSLAASPDERCLVVDCPDDDGWLVPSDLVANWMARHVSCPALDDLIAAHPLYEYDLTVDAAGHSRGGHRGSIVQWVPGVPHAAIMAAPPFLPGDREAPAIQRNPARFAAAFADLLEQLRREFPLEEMAVSATFDVDASPQIVHRVPI